MSPGGQGHEQCDVEDLPCKHKELSGSCKDITKDLGVIRSEGCNTKDPEVGSLLMDWQGDLAAANSTKSTREEGGDKLAVARMVDVGGWQMYYQWHSHD